MLKKLVCGTLKLLWDRKMSFPQKKNSDFGVYFYMQILFSFKDIFSHALVIDLSERMIVLLDW